VRVELSLVRVLIHVPSIMTKELEFICCKVSFDVSFEGSRLVTVIPRPLILELIESSSPPELGRYQTG